MIVNSHEQFSRSGKRRVASSEYNASLAYLCARWGSAGERFPSSDAFRVLRGLSRIFRRIETGAEGRFHGNWRKQTKRTCPTSRSHGSLTLPVNSLLGHRSWATCQGRYMNKHLRKLYYSLTMSIYHRETYPNGFRRKSLSPLQHFMPR